uniref:Uncharacterized protein n=1 Tax=Oryza sativa subsp. japonica TaxID=39947 RepID=Q8S6Z0_ORYSJ|nr:Hypothetical protein [Oryza sativa Japonica Group]
MTMQVERSAAPVDSAAAQPMEEVGRQLPATMQEGVGGPAGGGQRGGVRRGGPRGGA